MVARLPNGKVTSFHVNILSKARIKILKIFQEMGFNFFFLIMPRYWSEKTIFLLSYLPLNYPKAEKTSNFMKPAQYWCSVLSVAKQFTFLSSLEKKIICVLHRLVSDEVLINAQDIFVTVW